MLSSLNKSALKALYTNWVQPKGVSHLQNSHQKGIIFNFSVFAHNAFCIPMFSKLHKNKNVISFETPQVLTLWYKTCCLWSSFSIKRQNYGIGWLSQKEFLQKPVCSLLQAFQDIAQLPTSVWVTSTAS